MTALELIVETNAKEVTLRIVEPVIALDVAFEHQAPRLSFDERVIAFIAGPGAEVRLTRSFLGTRGTRARRDRNHRHQVTGCELNRCLKSHPHSPTLVRTCENFTSCAQNAKETKHRS